ncbi:uncharacterized protein N7482_009336 [Penicillium canariense]|uniref:Uncharacterized protein n=1 Tax=Penicillium canariense TaxID=189055 RepID=A0A9W9LFR0_9EURO|nr:uncharacterized protein N7482_009336 [Penicillium canariense]KAJ5152858.1 hypothetical protein N7482_009336 [Penicillium canariense]
MSDSRGVLPESMDVQLQNSQSFSTQVQDDPAHPVDKNALLVGKPATSVRAPKPTSLSWSPVQPVDRDQPAEGSAMGSGAQSSGPVSPVSLGSLSEALRTPNASERQKYTSKQPSSPGGTSQLPPRLHSPASQIFERSVQEDILPQQASPSIPAHIRTENYIPPVLEASSAAITDEQLDPDSVEIITHSLHQSAAAGVTGPSTAEQSLASSGIVDHTGIHSMEADEVSSTHGALDPTDVRRLSFISFADVVNAEHAETVDSVYSRELSQAGGASGHSTSFFAWTWHIPPTSIATSYKGLEMSPHHGTRGAGSPLPLAQSPISSSFGGELNVETMRQALRRTGSGDLGGIVSQTAIAIGNDETLDRPF